MLEISSEKVKVESFKIVENKWMKAKGDWKKSAAFNSTSIT